MVPGISVLLRGAAHLPAQDPVGYDITAGDTRDGEVDAGWSYSISCSSMSGIPFQGILCISNIGLTLREIRYRKNNLPDRNKNSLKVIRCIPIFLLQAGRYDEEANRRTIFTREQKMNRNCSVALRFFEPGLNAIFTYSAFPPDRVKYLWYFHKIC